MEILKSRKVGFRKTEYMCEWEKSKWNGEVTEETRYRKGMVLNTYKIHSVRLGGMEQRQNDCAV